MVNRGKKEYIYIAKPATHEMKSRKPKTFVSSLKEKWIWVLTSIISLSIICAIHTAFFADSDAEHSDTGDQEQHDNNLSGPVAPLHEYFLSIQRTGAEFIPDIVGDYSKLNLDTILIKKAAIFLGVCAADIGYLCAYGRTQQALNYMDVCLGLNEMVGGPDVNDSHILERFKENSSNPDSLNQILNHFNNNTIRYLLEHEHPDLGLLMVFSTFIEAQYITTQIIQDYPEDLQPNDIRWQVLSPLISMVMGQKEFLKELIDKLEGLEGKENWEHATINSLTELYRTYTKPVSMYYPPPEDRTSFKRTLLLSEQIDQIRANLIF